MPAGYKWITKANRVCATMGRVKRISRTRDVILKCTGSVADDPSEDKMVSANESMADDTKNTLVQMQQYNCTHAHTTHTHARTHTHTHTHTYAPPYM